MVANISVRAPLTISQQYYRALPILPATGRSHYVPLFSICNAAGQELRLSDVLDVACRSLDFFAFSNALHARVGEIEQQPNGRKFADRNFNIMLSGLIFNHDFYSIVRGTSPEVAITKLESYVHQLQASGTIKPLRDPADEIWFDYSTAHPPEEQPVLRRPLHLARVTDKQPVKPQE